MAEVKVEFVGLLRHRPGWVYAVEVEKYRLRFSVSPQGEIRKTSGSGGVMPEALFREAVKAVKERVRERQRDAARSVPFSPGDQRD